MSPSDVATRAVRFDPTMNWGHVGIMLTMVIGLVGAIVSATITWSTLSANQVQFQQQQTELSKQQKETSDKLAAVSQSVASNAWQISSLTSGLADQKTTLGQILTTVGSIQQDIAVIKARDNNSGAK